MLRHTSRWTTVLGCILVLLAATVAPATAHHKSGHQGGPSVTGGHPSGKDRSVEPGGSGTQGKSPSTPDQDGRGPERDEGGTDKPGGPGGADPTDQDGNNGCGNDTDFDDDNEGWCGGRPRSGVAVTEPPGQLVGQELPGSDADGTTGTGGSGTEGHPGTGGSDGLADAGAEVLGVLLQAGEDEATGEAAGEGSELATTGIPASALALASLVLLTLGGGLVLTTGRRRRGKN